MSINIKQRLARAIWKQRQVCALLGGVELLDWEQENERQRMDVLDEVNAVLAELRVLVDEVIE